MRKDRLQEPEEESIANSCLMKSISERAQMKIECVALPYKWTWKLLKHEREMNRRSTLKHEGFAGFKAYQHLGRLLLVSIRGARRSKLGPLIVQPEAPSPT